MRVPTLTLVLLLCLPALQASAESGKAIVSPTSEAFATRGVVLFRDTPEGLAVEASFSGVEPGEHGFHVHHYGDCGDTGEAAGGHYNPHGTVHGFLPHNGHEHAHAGDMGNVSIREDGTGELALVLPGVALAEVAGRAVILHADPDDFGQPTGNAGGRIGCGPILHVAGN